MLKSITVLSILLLLFSCKWKTAEHAVVEEKEAPVIVSLKDASLPCFDCHLYEKFAVSEQGRFSHQKHIGFGVHCNQCHIIKSHETITLNKNICDNCHKMTTFSYTSSAMPVNFSHQGHASMFGCNECHPKIFQMKKGATRMTMDAMYGGNYCGKCHDGKMAFSSRDCAKCHNMSATKKDFRYSSGDMSPAIFSHQIHTGMFNCDSCHPAIFQYKKGGSGMTMDSLYQNKFCGKCHDGQTAFGSSECQRCHK